MTGEQDILELRANNKRLQRHINELSRFGRTKEGGVNRVAFGKANIEARGYIRSIMVDAGLKVRIDAVGNMIGRRPGSDDTRPVILFGSHIDTVPNGGKYDGSVGVLAAIECGKILQEKQLRTRHPLEVIIFVDEEGGLTGSRGVLGELTPEALQIETFSGLSVAQGIAKLGGDPKSILQAKRPKNETKAFLELHIEQGKILISEGINIGVVKGIVGINRWQVTIKGEANHAGTTPMHLRRDALLTASHFIIAVHRVANRIKGTHVATVGEIEAFPGAANVIAGRVACSLEIRDLSSAKIERIYKTIKLEAERIAIKCNTPITLTPQDVTAIPAPTDPTIQQLIIRACRQLKLTHKVMPSGAGHDAQNMARLVPTGMIFIPSKGGISHSPKEFSYARDVANGVNVLLHTILQLDKLN